MHNNNYKYINITHMKPQSLEHELSPKNDVQVQMVTLQRCQTLGGRRGSLGQANLVEQSLLKYKKNSKEIEPLISSRENPELQWEKVVSRHRKLSNVSEAVPEDKKIGIYCLNNMKYNTVTWEMMKSLSTKINALQGTTISMLIHCTNCSVSEKSMIMECLGNEDLAFLVEDNSTTVDYCTHTGPNESYFELTNIVFF
jgi:ATP-dependent 26S proteasome regulatory subunit